MAKQLYVTVCNRQLRIFDRVFVVLWIKNQFLKTWEIRTFIKR